MLYNIRNIFFGCDFQLDKKYFDSIYSEMKQFFEENAITEKDGFFANEQKAITVNYDEARKMFTLSVADIVEGNVCEYREINAWLFDEGHNERDAVAVGIDFVNSLQKEFGIKATRNFNNMIELPTASKDGSTNVHAFSKKILDVFPALKEEYKTHISTYGNFLYLNFYGEHLRPRLIRLFEEGTKKQIKKFYDVVCDAYEKGDRDTVNTAVIILVAAAYNNEKVTEVIKEMLKDNTHFLTAFQMEIPFFAKNAKLKEALIKE